MSETNVTTFENLNFTDLTKFLEDRSKEIKSIFDDKQTEGSDGTKSLNMSVQEIEDVRAKSDELDAATKRWEGMRELDEGYQRTKRLLAEMSMSQPPGGINLPDARGAEATAARKSLGTLFTDSETYKSRVGKHANAKQEYDVYCDEYDTSIKATTISTTAGLAPANNRTPIVVDFAVRRPMVMDLIPSTNTTLTDIKYMEETTFENNADTVAEGAGKPQSDVKWTQRNRPVEVIATFLKITRQQLDDIPSIRGIIDNRGELFLKLAEEDQLLNGNGTSPDLLGFLSAAIQSQAKGADPVPDAIYKSYTKIRSVGFAEPTGTVMHPNDWQDIRLLRTTIGDYIWGNPSEAGPERIWGKPVIITTAMTENTALSGDFQLYSQIWRRMGVTIDVGLVDQDFTNNLQTIRFEERLALTIYRLSAFCKTTGV